MRRALGAATRVVALSSVVVALASCKRAPEPIEPHAPAYYRGVDTTPSAAPATRATASAPAALRFDDGVTVHLARLAPGGDTISFGVPLPPRAVADLGTIRIGVENPPREIAARVVETLAALDAKGHRVGARAVLVEFPAATMATPELDVRVRFTGGAATPTGAPVTAKNFADVSYDSPETVQVAARTLVKDERGATISESSVTRRTLFTGREPRVLATFPEGYLAATRVLGGQVTARRAADPAFRGLKFLSDEAVRFGGSAIFDEPYALSTHPDSVPDPKTAFEGWLYDRCATLLVLYAHSGEERFLRHGLRTCSWYAREIPADGPRAGIFSGKPELDPKYSHVRGLEAYYALTGDEAALRAARAIGDMWLSDKLFVIPYRAGHTRGPDKLWTERLLGTSLEGLLYAHRMTGESKYLDAVRGLVDTAYRHVTGDANDLATINPGATFPPQGCFIHSAEQQGEGKGEDPWCSAWMSDLVIDPLLRYQEETGDDRVDTIFIRLARFLRDVGTAYFRGNVLDDHFLAPSFCDDPRDASDRRQLVPLYGAGLAASGKRKTSAEYSDFQHCPDATALTAAALRALRRRGEYDKNPVGPFASEGEALLAMHGELLFCAERTFQSDTRPKRSPARWTPQELAPGLADPAAFLEKNKIGYPQRNVSPQRKVSWWFNTSLEQWSLLLDAGVAVPLLQPGRVEGPPCRR